MRAEIVREAEEELAAAISYYEQIEPGLGLRLKHEALDTIRWIQKNPELPPLAEEIARQYPCLGLAQVHAALTYYFDHREEIESELLAEDREAEDWKRAHPTAPLLLRLKAQASP